MNLIVFIIRFKCVSRHSGCLSTTSGCRPGNEARVGDVCPSTETELSLPGTQGRGWQKAGHIWCPWQLLEVVIMESEQVISNDDLEQVPG